MPRHQEPKKDVISCEKLWVEANMTNPYMSKVVYRRGTQGTETSKYLQEKKENSIP